MTTLPRDIQIGVPPLVGKFGKSEAEHAAALIILVCKAENAWRPVFPREIGVMMRDTPLHMELGRLFSNPFFRPDVHRLVADGWARWVGDSGDGDGRAVELTPAAIEKLSLERCLCLSGADCICGAGRAPW